MTERSRNRLTVALEPLAPRHAKAIQRIASDPRVQATTLLPEPYPANGAERFVRYARSAWGREFNWAIVASGDGRGSGEVVGCAALKEIHDEQADTGYYVDPERWGEGVAPEAVRQVCAVAFSDLGLTRVTAHPLADNGPSRRVLEKAGFTLEAVIRNPFAKWSPEAQVARYCREGPRSQ